MIINSLPFRVKVCLFFFELFALPFLFVWCFISRLRNSFVTKPELPRIFMGTMHINNWVYVAKALRALGYSVDLIVWSPPFHEIDAIDYDTILSQKWSSLFSTRMGRYIFQFFLFLWAVWRYDLFIFCFMSRLMDRSLMLKWVELPLIRFCGKKLIFNSYGADVMTPSMTLGNRYKYSVRNGYLEDPNCRDLDEESIAKNRSYCQKWAHCVISAIDHVQYLERVDECFHMRCIDINGFIPNYHTQNDKPVIIHAPNHRSLKGTDCLIKAVAELQKEDISCELLIFEGKPHLDVIKAITQGDIVADQFLVGAYARFSIESMSLGKPVLCYLRDDLFQSNPIWAECPIINANPDNLKEKLRELILVSSEEREQIGLRGRSFVEKYHSMDYVGKRLSQIILKVWCASAMANA